MNRPKGNRKGKVFLLFLLLSTTIWVLTNLSELYEDTLSVDLQFNNIPQNVFFSDGNTILEDALTFRVSGSGFNLLFQKMQSNLISLDMKYLKKTKANSYYLLTKDYKNSMVNHFRNGIVLDNILNDTIFLSMGTLGKKQVPVQLNIAIDYLKGYASTKEIEWEPKMVTIHAPSAILDTLTTISTTLFSRKEVQNNFKDSILLAIPDLKTISSSTKYVSCLFTVGKITQKELLIPYDIRNVPSVYTIQSLPSDLKISFQVALEDFDSISSDDFTVVCDYKETINNKIDYLVPRIIKQPKNIQNLQISPKRVEFLLKDNL